MRKKSYSDQKRLLKFVAEGLAFAKILRSLEKLIQTVKRFWVTENSYNSSPIGFSYCIVASRSTCHYSENQKITFFVF